jgi:hypothetical protein
MIQSRNEIGLILKNDIVGCELGVFEGSFSEILLSTNKFKRLYLVDLFEGEINSGDTSGNNIVYKDGQKLQKTVSEKFKNEKRIEVVKKDSVSFLNAFPDNFFDFVYIDTSHKYEQTKAELKACLNKVKKSGIIAGHDYNAHRFSGVVKAVDEFASQNNLKLNLTTCDGLETFYFINE